MRRAFRNLVLITVPTCLLLVVLLEVIFRTVIPAAEIPYKSSGSENVLRYDPNRTATGVFTAGMLAQQRASWRINNEGWPSAIDYAPAPHDKPLIAVIGDSFVEAQQVDPDENFVAVLRRQLGTDYIVYGFGMQGAALSQYLHVARYVRERFHPDVLVFNVVHNDFDESLRSLFYHPTYLQLSYTDGAFRETQVLPYSSPPRNQLIRTSALARYLWLNAHIGGLTEVIRRGGELNANIEVDRAAANRESIKGAVSYVLQRLRAENPEIPLVFLVDAPRFDLYAGRLETSNVIWLNGLLADACDNISRCFLLDLSDSFSEAFRQDSIRFESPYDAHWNEHGHAVVGRALHRKLLEWKVLTAQPGRVSQSRCESEMSLDSRCATNTDVWRD